MNWYRLPGLQGYKPGTLVDLCPGFGIVQAVITVDYKLPDKCVLDGPVKLAGRPVSLYSIYSLEKPSMHSNHAKPVWGVTT